MVKIVIRFLMYVIVGVVAVALSVHYLNIGQQTGGAPPLTTILTDGFNSFHHAP